MGRQAKAKRERARIRMDELRQGSDKGKLIHLTGPLPGAEHLVGDDGLFDDCEICRALRAGDEAEAIRLIQEHSDRQAEQMKRSRFD
jgi:hypothetical protein